MFKRSLCNLVLRSEACQMQLFIPSTPLPRTQHYNIPFSHRTSCCATAPQSVPRSLPELVTLASKSLSTALTTSPTTNRLRLTAQVPGLDPRIENTYPYNEALLFSLILKIVIATPHLASIPIRLLFASSGTAASAFRVYERENLSVPENITVGSFGRREYEGSNVDGVNIVISARDRRGDKVWKDIKGMVEDSGEGQIWILANEELGEDGVIGIKERENVSRFVKSFKDCFYFRGLYVVRRPKLVPEELGALLLTEVGKWRVFKLIGSRYELLEEFQARPSRQQLENMTDRLITRPMLSKGSENENNIDDSGYLVMLIGLSVVTSALFWYLRVLQSGTLALN